MKIFTLSMVAISILSFSLSAFAQRVTITGEPVVIEERAGVYVPTSTVTTTNDYYYFTVGDKRRVCYKQVQPGLAKVDVGILKVRLGESVVDVHCYDYSPDYFVVD